MGEIASDVTGTPLVVVGVSWWNRAALSAALSDFVGSVRFADTVRDGLAEVSSGGGQLVVWASRLDGTADRLLADAGVSPWRVEDGFLRSVGLGAGLQQGGAYVLDRSGIYYDATRPSDIETMLETAEIVADEVVRASALMAAIRAARVTKYNVGRRTALAWPAGRERILVVGQVSVDAGVRLTLSNRVDVTRAERVNRDVLAAAREEHPRAFIVYKPHPDVAAGLRPGAIDPGEIRRLADAVVDDADIVDLIDGADRLVTLSSLSGFEALLRGKAVTALGLPFYAGWGLTDDRMRTSRRTRRRSIEEATAIALIRYTRYVDPVRLTPCTPEAMVEALAALKRDPRHRAIAIVKRHASWLGRKLGL